MRFVAEYGKTYATKSHLNSKYEVFARNYETVQQHNQLNLDYTMGVNKFSDMTVEEFSEHFHKVGL